MSFRTFGGFTVRFFGRRMGRCGSGLLVLVGFGGSGVRCALAGSRLLGGLFGLLLGHGVHRGTVFAIACQISLTPRPVRAENGSGSTPSWRMARSPCSCSVRFILSVLVATTTYSLP